MRKYAKKLFIMALCLLSVSCRNIVSAGDENKSQENILFEINAMDSLSRAAVPQAFINGIYYQLTIYRSGNPEECVKSKFQTTLSFTIPAPSWTGSSVAKLDMYTPRSEGVFVDINTDVDGNVSISSSVCMTGSIDFDLRPGTRVFNHTIPLSFSGLENGTISLPVTVGSSGIKSCIIVPDSAGNDSSKYIISEVASGLIYNLYVAPFSDRAVFYFFEKEYADLTIDEPLSNAKIIYSDSITVFSKTTTDRWSGIDGNEKTVDLESLLYSTFVVSSDGDDSKSGSSLYPVGTIATAVSRCPQSGGRIYLRGNPKDTETITIDKPITIEKLEGSSGTPSIQNVVINDSASDFDVVLKNVKISKAGATGISVGKKCSLVLDNVEVSGCNNGIVAEEISSVNMKNSSVVKSCTSYGIKLDNESCELKLDGVAVDGDSALYDSFAGSEVDVYYRKGKFIRLNTVCTDAGKSDDILSGAIRSIIGFGDGSRLLLGKTTDSSVTWYIKENGLTINGGSSGSTYTIAPSKSDGRVVIQRDSNAAATAKFSLAKSVSAGGTWNINNFTFRNGINTGTSGYGGAFNISGGKFVFDSCKFENNSAGMGGAVYISRGTADFTSCTFGGTSTTGNSSEQSGGAIYATSDSSTVTLSSTENSIKYNKSCTSASITGTSAFGGGAIYLGSGAKCTMDGGTIENNSVEKTASGTGAKTCGGSICVVGSSSSFTLKGGTIKNGSIPSSGDSRFGQDVYNEGTLRVAETGWSISNDKNAGTTAEVYSTSNLFHLEGINGFTGDDEVYDFISNGTGTAFGIDFIGKHTSNPGLIRLNKPSKNNFYGAFALLGNFSKGCTLFCGMSTDTNTEYDCDAVPTITTTGSDDGTYSATSFKVTPTAAETSSNNSILIKSSLKFTGKGSYTLRNVIFSGTSKEISVDLNSTSKLILDNTTVKNCSGITVADGVNLVYEGNSLVGSHDVPVTLNGSSKITLSSVLTSTENADFDGYIGYVRLETYPSNGSKTIFYGSKVNDFAKYFYILPDGDKNLYELNDSNAVVKKVISLTNPKTLMDWQALLPASPGAGDYPAENEGVVLACKSQKDLEVMADWVNNGKTTLIKVEIDLKNDIELHGEWTPIGKVDGNMNSGVFRGVFNGNDHKISGLNAKRSVTNTYPALFQNITSGSYTINNVSRKDGVIMNLTVSGVSECAGIVGKLTRGIVRNCISEVVVTAPSNASCAGGICGQNSGEIGYCTNKGAVTGGSNVGGIVGSIVSGSSTTPVYNCENIAAVSGTSYVGGIAGGYSSRIVHCKNTGSVTASGNYAGGIAGRFSGNTDTAPQYGGQNIYTRRGIYDCWNEGSVSAGNYAGGITGYLNGSSGNVYEVISVVQNGQITALGGNRGLFYGITESSIKLKDGCLSYVSISGNPTAASGDNSSYETATNGNIADTNCNGTEDNNDSNQTFASINSDNIVSTLNGWKTTAFVAEYFMISVYSSRPEAWDENFVSVPNWPEVGAQIPSP